MKLERVLIMGWLAPATTATDKQIGIIYPLA